MNPRDEFRDLVSRSRRLFNAALLLVITALLLVVAVGTLFCTIFITCCTMGRNTIDRATMRFTVQKGAELHVLP